MNNGNRNNLNTSQLFKLAILMSYFSIREGKDEGKEFNPYYIIRIHEA